MTDLVAQLVGALEGFMSLDRQCLRDIYGSEFLNDVDAALSAAKDGGWLPIETAPKDGKCLVWVDTDDGGEVMKLQRNSEGHWLYEGEPTFAYSFYLKPTAWQPLPNPPKEQNT